MNLLSLRLFSIFFLAVPSDRNNSVSELLTVGLETHPASRSPVPSLEVDYKSLSPPWSPVSCRRFPHNPPSPPTSRGCLFQFFLLALRALVLLHPVPDHVFHFPHSLAPLSFRVLLFSASCDCFYPPTRWDWGILTWGLWLVNVLESCGLCPEYYVLFWRISTH